MAEQNFNLVLSGVPYSVKVSPFDFNEEKRFLVSYNGGDEHVFTYDSSVGRLTAIDDEASTMPDDLEQAIAVKLQGGRF